LARQLVTHGRVETTVARAKDLKALADKIVTIGKQV